MAIPRRIRGHGAAHISTFGGGEDVYFLAVRWISPKVAGVEFPGGTKRFLVSEEGRKVCFCFKEVCSGQVNASYLFFPESSKILGHVPHKRGSIAAGGS